MSAAGNCRSIVLQQHARFRRAEPAVIGFQNLPCIPPLSSRHLDAAQAVPAKLSRYGLSQVINGLLQLGEHPNARLVGLLFAIVEIVLSGQSSDQ